MKTSYVRCLVWKCVCVCLRTCMLVLLLYQSWNDPMRGLELARPMTCPTCLGIPLRHPDDSQEGSGNMQQMFPGLICRCCWCQCVALRDYIQTKMLKTTLIKWRGSKCAAVGSDLLYTLFFKETEGLLLWLYSFIFFPFFFFTLNSLITTSLYMECQWTPFF